MSDRMSLPAVSTTRMGNDRVAGMAPGKRRAAGGLLLIVAAGALLLIANRREHLRGAVSPSDGGKTYLSIDDDNGGRCGDMVVDGELWPHPIGEARPIEAGRHSIHCGSPDDRDTDSITFEIPDGVVFRFGYWGP